MVSLDANIQKIDDEFLNIKRFSIAIPFVSQNIIDKLSLQQF